MAVKSELGSGASVLGPPVLRGHRALREHILDSLVSLLFSPSPGHLGMLNNNNYQNLPSIHKGQTLY